MNATAPRWASVPDLDTPAVVVDVAVVDRNITRMVHELRDRGVALRPHAKTHKSLDVARLQLSHGATGITTATLGEAEVFVDGGIPDVFIAYPIWAVGRKAQRLADLARRAPRLLVGADNPSGVAALAAAVGRSSRLEVVVEVESGEHRTGVQSPEQAVAVARAILDSGLRLAGVFTHGGHSYASADAALPAANDEVDALLAAAQAIGQLGVDVPMLSAGSTPTALLSSRDGVTEERPGTFVFGDRQQVALGAHPTDAVALFVIATVVSTEVPGQVVLDAGAKILSKDLPATLDGHGFLPHYPQAIVRRVFDHHAIVEVARGEAPALGERVIVVPNHVCPVVNLVDELYLVDDGAVVGRWPVDARGRNT